MQNVLSNKARKGLIAQEFGSLPISQTGLFKLATGENLAGIVGEVTSDKLGVADNTLTAYKSAARAICRKPGDVDRNGKSIYSTNAEIAESYKQFAAMVEIVRRWNDKIPQVAPELRLSPVFAEAGKRGRTAATVTSDEQFRMTLAQFLAMTDDDDENVDDDTDELTDND